MASDIPQPMALLKLDEENHDFGLEADALSKILLREDVAEKKVAIVSVAGAFRKGKSFLLNFFLRYLQNGGKQDHWMGDETMRLDGFKWRSGMERETIGIHLWSEPFFVMMPSGEENLTFLIRDWQWPDDAEYGFDGGLKVVQRFLQVSDNQQEELKRIRQNIGQCFSKISCFLMPYPGSKVACGREFAGQLSKIDAEFKQHLAILVPALLAPQNLVLKQINGKTIKCRELLEYIHGFVEVFKGDRLPKPESIFMATAEISHINAVSDAVTGYEKRMEVRCDDDYEYTTMELEEFMAWHQECLKMAILKFHETPKMGKKEISKKYTEDLVEKIKVSYKKYLKEFEKAKAEASHKEALSVAITKYSQRMEELCGGEINCKMLAKFHQDYVQEAHREFELFPKESMGNIGQRYKDQLDKELQKLFKTFEKSQKEMDALRRHHRTERVWTTVRWFAVGVLPVVFVTASVFFPSVLLPFFYCYFYCLVFLFNGLVRVSFYHGEKVKRMM